MSIPQTPQGGSGRFYPQCSALLIKALGETASCTTLLSHVILSKNSFLAAHSPVPGESECKGTAFPETCKLFGRLFCRNHALFTFLDMSQGHRRHGGGGYTLLYYIGLGGKGRGTTAGQDRAGSAVYGTRGEGDGRTEGQKQGGKGNGRQKDKRTEKKEKGRKTEGQKNRKKGRQKDKGTEKRAGNLQLPSLFDATNFVTVLYGDFCLLY